MSSLLLDVCVSCGYAIEPAENQDDPSIDRCGWCDGIMHYDSYPNDVGEDHWPQYVSPTGERRDGCWDWHPSGLVYPADRIIICYECYAGTD